MNGASHRLGLPAAIAIVAGSLLAPAILVKASFAPAWVWIAAGGLVLCGALAIGSVSKTGGPYVLLRDAFGPLAGFCCGWTFFFASGAIVASLAGMFANSFGLGPGGSRTIATVLIAGLSWVNHRSLRAGAGLQVMLAVMQAAVLALAIRAEAPVTHLLYPEAWLVALVGWPTLTFIADEVREPRRTLPRAFLIGLIVCTALYALAAGRNGGRLAAALLAAGAANAWFLTAPWISFVHSRDHLFFRRFGEIHGRHGTPSVAILMLGVWAATLAITGLFNEVLGYAWLCLWFFYGATAIAAAKLRPRASALSIPFALLAFGLVIAVARNFPPQALAAAVMIASGVPMYYIWRRYLR